MNHISQPLALETWACMAMVTGAGMLRERMVQTCHVAGKPRTCTLQADERIVRVMSMWQRLPLPLYAVEHVRNHPRWDPDIELWLDSDDPIGVGTIIHRRNKRSGTPVEGIIEVVEFEPNRVFAMVVHDGQAVLRGRMIFEAISEAQTRITTDLDIPGMDENADKTFLNSRLERRIRTRKRLMETEIQGT